MWSDNNKRFFHDNTGYIILQGDSCITSSEHKEGQWKDFMGMYKPEMLSDTIFSIYLKHRKDTPASYIYIVLPSSTRQSIQVFDSNTIQVIRNDKEAQAVVIKDLCYASIYKPTHITVEGQNPIMIAEPGTYIMNIREGKFVSRQPFIST